MPAKPKEPASIRPALLIRGVLLLALLVLGVLVLAVPEWLFERLSGLVGLVPHPKVAIPLLAALALPLFLTLMALATGKYTVSRRSFHAVFVLETVDLYSDLALTLLVILPVGLEAFLYLGIAFEGAMTIAGLTYIYRFIADTHTLVFSSGLIKALAVYVALLGVLALVLMYRDHITSWRDRYIQALHFWRSRLMKRAKSRARSQRRPS